MFRMWLSSADAAVHYHSDCASPAPSHIIRHPQRLWESSHVEPPSWCAHQVRRKKQARWQDKVQLLTVPGEARGLAETVNIAEHGTTAAASDHEEDVWVETTPPVQELAAPQYDAQQVWHSSTEQPALKPTQRSTVRDSAFNSFGSRLDGPLSQHTRAQRDARGYQAMCGGGAVVRMQAAAYMAARMPACYAAVFKVLEEVSTRLPAFAPESMLDFGAGPGTAVWAAREVHALAAQDPPCRFVTACLTEQLSAAGLEDAFISVLS